MMERETERDKKSREKKTQIYEAAITLFKEYGYDNVTIDMISEASGFSRGSIYNFFGSKAGILNIISKQVQEEISLLIEPTPDHIADPFSTLYTYLTAQIAGQEKIGRDLAAVTRKNLSAEGPKFFTIDNKLNTMVEYIDPHLLVFIERAMNAGTIKSEINAHELAYTLDVIGSGLTETWILYGENCSVIEESERVFKYILSKMLS